ncbi:hypothetical protein BKA82DRAFT_1006402 [Pisolithus tinctorius]|uniref:Uncharacterized protein n=1 Tax=Pisolithus tinctorius Marx 270 TaxID=870435 RepID=A0A0C3NNP0_PISTI|nr:hypothetical protein BKA82DRAFT_1006402 [Pisolithus tinctorius]KIN96913.1 hypothetical protein M404DRAFT_1006402 [Pisolithus tinctorius Marx 270]
MKLRRGHPDSSVLRRLHPRDIAVDVSEGLTTFPTGEDAVGAEVDMAESDELLLADAEGSIANVVRVNITTQIVQLRARVVPACPDCRLV